MARKVFITGASSGIGKATAYAFAKHGDHLILCARRMDRLEEIRSDLVRNFDAAVTLYAMDVQNKKEVEAVTGQILREHGYVDILVNNAGLALSVEKFQDYDFSDVETMIDTNITGLLRITRLILPSMVERDSGQIINIGSTAGLYAYPGAAVYCATKAAVRVLSDGIRMDTIDKNIKVSTIQPGLVKTEFSNVRFHGDAKMAEKPYEGIEALTAQDIADTILFVANCPPHMQISDITIMATKQAAGFMLYRE